MNVCMYVCMLALLSPGMCNFKCMYVLGMLLRPVGCTQAQLSVFSWLHVPFIQLDPEPLSPKSQSLKL